MLRGARTVEISALYEIKPDNYWRSGVLRSLQSEVGRRKRMYYTYILRGDADGRYYVGATSDIKRRLNEHNSATVQSTRLFMPWKIVWYCAFREKEKALAFEKYLKSGSGTSFRYRHLSPDKRK